MTWTIAVALAIAANLVYGYIEYRQVTVAAQNNAESQGRLLASILQEAVATHQYQFVELLFSEWANAYPDTVSIALKTNDDNVIVNYGRTPPASGALTVVQALKQDQLRLVLVKSTRNVYDAAIVRFVILTVILLLLIVVGDRLLSLQGNSMADKVFSDT